MYSFFALFPFLLLDGHKQVVLRTELEASTAGLSCLSFLFDLCFFRRHTHVRCAAAAGVLRLYLLLSFSYFGASPFAKKCGVLLSFST